MSQHDEELRNLAQFPEENPSPVLRVSSDGQLLYANRAAAPLLHQWKAGVGETVPDWIREEVSDALERGANREMETICGKSIFSFVLVPILERNYVNFYGREVTRRKRIESALYKSKENLKRAQEIAHLGSWELDLTTNVLTWSDEVYRIFGYEPREIEASYAVFLDAVYPEDRDAVNEAYTSSIKDGRDTYEIEHRIVRHRTGEVRFVHEKCEHIRDALGGIVRSVGMVHDITERKRREDEIHRLNASLSARAADLEAVNKELEAFNYTVAHDLRRPLTIILGYCQILEEMDLERKDGQLAECLRMISDNALNLNELIDALLNFSRLAHSKPRVENVNLTAMAQEVMTGLMISSPSRRVDFMADEDIVVQGDAALLRVVLDNLLGNAWKYTSGREVAEIAFGMAQSESERTLFVRDNGSGFPMEEADRLFMPFQRLRNAQEVNGFGIGLATAERIIHSHGGTIWAESRPGAGATFFFSLAP